MAQVSHPVRGLSEYRTPVRGLSEYRTPVRGLSEYRTYNKGTGGLGLGGPSVPALPPPVPWEKMALFDHLFGSLTPPNLEFAPNKKNSPENELLPFQSFFNRWMRPIPVCVPGRELVSDPDFSVPERFQSNSKHKRLEGFQVAERFQSNSKHKRLEGFHFQSNSKHKRLEGFSIASISDLKARTLL